MEALCPCGRPRPYDDCCGRYHRGETSAPTAEDLMRSRYSAFAVGDVPYLERTWSPATRPDDVRVVPGQRWTGLTVLAVEGGGMLDTVGTVEFEASFERDGLPGSHHERSTFARDESRWVYVGTAD